MELLEGCSSGCNGAVRALEAARDTPRRDHAPLGRAKPRWLQGEAAAPLNLPRIGVDEVCVACGADVRLTARRGQNLLEVQHAQRAEELVFCGPRANGSLCKTQIASLGRWWPYEERG
eukprot:scaffold96829_cov30-Tisochrysis_lutea.AAC.1